MTGAPNFFGVNRAAMGRSSCHPGLMLSALTLTILAAHFCASAQNAAVPCEITEEAFAKHAAILSSDGPNTLSTAIAFAASEARIVRLVIRRSNASQPCLDELEVYGPDAPAANLALASGGAVARASSLLPGYAAHTVAHLNDGLYGNDYSWIAATEGEEWAEIELPAPGRTAG